MKNLTTNKSCRACKSKRMTLILDFGSTPLANSFLNKNELNKKENYFPLRIYLCQKCNLLQMKDIVSPEILFHDYVYVSSTSSIFIKHFEDFANHIQKTYSCAKKSLVVDIGSNDGILLKPFQKLGYLTLGVEPAKNIAQIANKNGIKTFAEFFNEKFAQKIYKKFGIASLVTATNVFAHINDLDQVIKGVKILIQNKGIFIIEVPYLIDFLKNNLFDTVYHEHLSYFSLSPLITLFKRFHMQIIKVEKTDSHGGSLRVFITDITNSLKKDKSVEEFIKKELHQGLDKILIYKQFAQRVNTNKRLLKKMLNDLKSQGYNIAGYGAPAKGNTLLNYFEIDSTIIDFIVDDSIYKQNLYTPGTHILVTDPKRLYIDKPDYVLLLAWNFTESIVKTHSKYSKSGGKFIQPIPYPKII